MLCFNALLDSLFRLFVLLYLTQLYPFFGWKYYNGILLFSVRQNTTQETFERFLKGSSLLLLWNHILYLLYLPTITWKTVFFTLQMCKRWGFKKLLKQSDGGWAHKCSTENAVFILSILFLTSCNLCKNYLFSK